MSDSEFTGVALKRTLSDSMGTGTKILKRDDSERCEAQPDLRFRFACEPVACCVLPAVSALSLMTERQQLSSAARNLCDDILDDLTMHVGQAEVTALEFVGQAFVVDTQ